MNTAEQKHWPNNYSDQMMRFPKITKTQKMIERAPKLRTLLYIVKCPLSNNMADPVGPL